MRLWTWVCVAVVVIGLPAAAFAGETAAELDRLHDSATPDNYSESLRMVEAALAERPDDIELLWRAARACRWYGELAKRRGVENWEAICAEYGKKGMGYAEQVITLAPERPEGHLWYGYSVGIYSDGVSILTALKEGLKGKTQKSFEKVYALDKSFEEAGAVLALGRFWSVLPWPLTDRKKALAYLKEYQQTPYFAQRPEGPIYLAELLIAMGGREHKAEAGEILTAPLHTEDPYFLEWRERLLNKVAG